MDPLSPDYLNLIKKRGRRSRVYKRFQLIGLLIAMHLRDERHKSLYIKLAKENNDPDRLLAIAKTIGDNRRVKNKGAYFMRLSREVIPIKNKKPKKSP